jgi:hypothetical protein
MAKPSRTVGARRLGVSAVCALAIGVGVVSAMALGHARPDTPPGAAAPVPSFTLGVKASPSPTPTPVPATPGGEERFLSLGTGAWWRGVAGACGGAGPVLERSVDGGALWQDVTPYYLGIGQITAVDSFTPTEGQVIASIGSGCAPAALRTYTQGEFWESYPEVLTPARYIDAADPSKVRLGAESVVAPCAAAYGLRASGSTVALVCDGAAYVLGNGADWRAVTTEGAVAVAASSAEVVVASRTEGCAGIAITRFPGADPAIARPQGCAEGLDASTPVAIAIASEGIRLWSGDEVRLLPNP